MHRPRCIATVHGSFAACWCCLLTCILQTHRIHIVNLSISICFIHTGIHLCPPEIDLHPLTLQSALHFPPRSVCSAAGALVHNSPCVRRLLELQLALPSTTAAVPVLPKCFLGDPEGAGLHHLCGQGPLVAAAERGCRPARQPWRLVHTRASKQALVPLSQILECL